MTVGVYGLIVDLAVAGLLVAAGYAAGRWHAARGADLEWHAIANMWDQLHNDRRLLARERRACTCHKRKATL